MSESLPQVRLETTKGTIDLELFEDDAPNTVANFVSLVESGFYDGIAFHRVIPNFMIQVGDPKTKDEALRHEWGTGGPGYCIDCETSGNPRKHDAKVLSMAHAGADTGGSQFFITHVPTPHLNGVHTVFGRVEAGEEVVDAIGVGDVVKTATVTAKRDHAYTPEKNDVRR
jgi:peptidyl-prolyl cis-trans isomerase B (cyclophilin B)